MEDIRHDGVVVSVKEGIAHVRILQASACAGCHARQMCQGADLKEKFMDCVMLEPMTVGDKVEVLVAETMGWKAVVIAYIVPFVILVAGVTILYGLGYSEAVAGLGAIAASVVYFLVVALFRSRLQKSFSFRARKL